MTRIDALLQTLATADVQFIIVGGVAGTVRGSAYFGNGWWPKLPT